MTVFLTQVGYDNYKKEIADLAAKEPDYIREVQRTAAMGDRSENAGYQNAKHILRKTQGRIRYLEKLLRNSKIIEHKKHDTVQIGSRVKILNVSTKVEDDYTIVDANEANPLKGFISYKSPLGNSIMHKKIGEKTKIQVGPHVNEYTVVEIN